MKKIIVAIDGLKYSESAVSYAIALSKITEAHLVGVFLDDFTYHSYRMSEAMGAHGETKADIKMLEKADDATRKQSVEFFEEACRVAGLNHTVHHDRSIAMQELLHESIYADMLVIDSKETFTRYEQSVPTRFIRELLERVQCPVVVTPSGYTPLEKVVFLYDGEPSSVFAIRAFSYLFGEGPKFNIEIVTVQTGRQSLHVPDNRLIKEFMKRHFPGAEYTVLKGNPETEIIQFLKFLEPSAMVVLGAYRRGMVSRWFRPSMADMLMEELKLPLFVAHN